MSSPSKAIAVAAGALLTVGASLGAPVAGAAKKNAKKAHGQGHGNAVHVIEHAVTDTEVPSGGGKDVTGNVLTFHNNVYDTADKNQVGTDLGFCIRISPTDGSWTCEWTTFLATARSTSQVPTTTRRTACWPSPAEPARTAMRAVR
jgi:hypothetical protein